MNITPWLSNRLNEKSNLVNDDCCRKKRFSDLSESKLLNSTPIFRPLVLSVSLQ